MKSKNNTPKFKIVILMVISFLTINLNAQYSREESYRSKQLYQSTIQDELRKEGALWTFTHSSIIVTSIVLICASEIPTDKKLHLFAGAGVSSMVTLRLNYTKGRKFKHSLIGTAAGVTVLGIKELIDGSRFNPSGVSSIQDFNYGALGAIGASVSITIGPKKDRVYKPKFQ